LTTITTAEGTASSDTTASADEKQRLCCAEAIQIKVSRAAASYFFTIDNPGMLKLADYMPSELQRLRDATCISAQETVCGCRPGEGKPHGF